MILPTNRVPDDVPADITIVVTTRNRRALLQRALEGMVNQTVPSHRYEILVLDNASTDGTDALVSTFTSGPVRLKHSVFSTVGVSHARNRAMELVDTRLVAYCDDDVSVGPEFVGAILDAFDEDPSVSTVGGRVLLGWIGERPKWLPPSREGFFGQLDLGPQRQELRYPQTLFGPAMAFHTSTLRQQGGFPTLLGPGTTMRFNDEVAVFHRQLLAGCKLVYDPRIQLTHHVHGRRATVLYFLRRSFAQGWSDAAMEGVSGTPSAWRCAKRAAARATELLVHRGRRLAAIVYRRQFSQAAVVEWMSNIAQDLGYIVGAAQMVFRAELRSGSWNPEPSLRNKGFAGEALGHVAPQE